MGRGGGLGAVANTRSTGSCILLMRLLTIPLPLLPPPPSFDDGFFFLSFFGTNTVPPKLFFFLFFNLFGGGEEGRFDKPGTLN